MIKRGARADGLIYNITMLFFVAIYLQLLTALKARLRDRSTVCTMDCEVVFFSVPGVLFHVHVFMSFHFGV